MSTAEDRLSAEQAASGREVARRRYRQANLVVAALAVAAAVGAATAGCHPTGITGLDVVYSAALGGAFTLAASRSSRAALLAASVVVFALSRSWLWAPAGAALALAFVSTWQRRTHRRMAALTGAVLIQVALRWPSAGFHGFTAAAAAVVCALVLVSAWRRSPAADRRRILVGGGTAVAAAVLLTLPAVISSFVARGPAEQGVSLARSSLNQLESDRTATARAQLRSAAADLRSAHHSIGGWWNLGADIVPAVSQNQRALSRSIRAGEQLTETSARTSEALDFSKLHYRQGRIDIGALEALRAPVDTMSASIGSASGALRSSRSGWLVGPLARRVTSLASEVDKARRATATAAAALRAAPAILGADGTRHYLVAFMTPAESRGLGGFIGAYGLLTVDRGSVRLTRSGRTTDFSQSPGAVHLSGPPAYLARYGRFNPQQHFQDLSYSPDLPTVENVMAQSYKQQTGQAIDGVMVLDPYSLAALLTFTGPITVPGLPQPLTAANAADELLRGQYLASYSANRQDLLQEALAVGFQRLTSGSLPSPQTVSSVLDPQVREGRLLFWSSHRQDQPLLERLGLAGAFPDPAPSSDLLAVTEANGANNKIDPYVHQRITDQVRYDPGTGHVDSTVTIRLTNDAPSSGMPDYVIGNFDTSRLPKGSAYVWLSLYSRLRLVASSLDGYPASFSAPVPELGAEAYSTYVDVPSGSSSVVTVHLSGTVGPGPYHITVRLQPTANPQSVTVVAVPRGWASSALPAGAAWTAGPDEVQQHTWAPGT